MIKKLKCLSLFLLLCCCTVQVQASNIQYRSGIAISKEISPEWKMVFSDSIRFRNGEHDLYYNDTDLGLVHSGLAPWLDISINMKWATQENDTGHWEQEVRPHFNLTLKKKLWGLTIKDKSRIEYRELEGSPDTWRYRNRITIQMPWELSSLKLQLYVADEAFFRLDGTGFFRNRVVGGLTFPISARLSGDVYYFWEETTSDESNSWEELNAFGFKLSFSF